MKKPILIAVIGYIIGIIVGLYFNFSIVFFYILLFAIYFLNRNFIKSNKRKEFKLISIKRYKRYLNLYFHKSTIFLVLIVSVISNTIILFQNTRYKNISNILDEKQNVSFIAIIVSDKEEKDYNNKYIAETKIDNFNIRFYIMVAKNINLQYGDKISIMGNYIKPESQRNYGGFDYYNYLKQLKIYGTIKCSKISILEKEQKNIIFRLSNKICLEIKDKINKNMKQDIASIVNGLILGDKSKIEEKLSERFSNAGISHILAVSGLHVTYIILGVSISLRKIIGKRKANFFTIFIVIFYMFITNFSPSITRAGIMSILYIISNIINRKNDILTSISFSLLVILIYNPFLIMNLGLQLSYGGTIGIILFYKTILDILNNFKIKNKKYKYIIPLKYKKILDKIKEIISISISVQIFIFPIIIFHLNKFSIYFIISNLLLAIIIGPLIILCFLYIIILLINIQIAKFLSFIIEYLIQILLFFSKIGNLPLSKIYIPTFKIYQIVIYYIIIFMFRFFYDIYNSRNVNKTKLRVKNLIALYKFRLKQKKLKSTKFFILICILLIILYKFPQKLKVYFIDVGQGDSTFIVTPNNKTILIDGGGSVNSSFDVGKNTLLPYILDRGFSKIDFVIVSHFDQDHVGGLITILEELKVEQVIIGKQFEYCENLERFLEIAMENNVKINVVEVGSRIILDKDCYLDVFWPDSRQSISENSINNNALVCKLSYKDFSMLFTGDIEQEAEKVLVSKYSCTDILKSTVLKIAHHGSNSSSTKEFLNLVQPKFALVGVGKNNLYGHPSDEVIERLEKLNCKVYRTDENGEITIEFNSKLIYKIEICNKKLNIM